MKGSLMRSTLPIFAAALVASMPAIGAETVAVGGFRSIQLRGGGVVNVVPGPVQRVTIVEGSSQFTGMRVERDGQLRIDTCNQRCPQTYRLRIEIQSPTVPNLGISGGGLITAAGGFRPQSQVSVAVNGGGKIDARSFEAGSVSGRSMAAARSSCGRAPACRRRSTVAVMSATGGTRASAPRCAAAAR